MPAWSTSTVVSTADFTVGKEHTAATVCERGKEKGGGGEKERERERERERDELTTYTTYMYARNIDDPLPMSHQRVEWLLVEWIVHVNAYITLGACATVTVVVS